MKYDKKIKVLTKQSLSDGMGGWINNGEVELTTIFGFTTPVKAEIMLKEYGFISTTSLKVFTKKQIPYKDLEGNPITPYLQLEDGTKYKILQNSDFGKVIMLLVELM